MLQWIAVFLESCLSFLYYYFFLVCFYWVFPQGLYGLGCVSFAGQGGFILFIFLVGLAVKTEQAFQL